MRYARITAAILVSVAAVSSLTAQSAPTANPLAALDPLLGRWQGTQEGQPGKGTVEREYSRILRSRFIEIHNRSVYPPQEKNPKGEDHLDTGVFSFDNTRKRVLFRQFHVEGFVVHYAMEPVTTPGTLVFISEAIENIPPGYRARETSTLLGGDELEEVFEMADPGKDFAVYSRSRMKRASATAVDRAFAQLDADWNTAHINGDTATLERIFADDMTVAVPGMPVMGKADSLAILASGKIKFERYESSDLQLRLNGESAIVTGRIERSRRMGDTTATDDWRFTKVYARRDGRWQVVSFHASPAAP